MLKEDKNLKEYIKQIPILINDIIYPTEPIFIKNLLPYISISLKPNIVKIRFTKPIDTELNKESLAASPALCNISGA